MSDTPTSGMKDHSQLVQQLPVRSMYTGMFHLALLRYQQFHSRMYHLDTELLRLPCCRIHLEGVCCNYGLPIKESKASEVCREGVQCSL